MKNYKSILRVSVCFFWFSVLLAGFFLPEKLNNPDAKQILEGPSFQHFLGTDVLGRDFFARLIIGTRQSLLIGISGSFLILMLSTVFIFVSQYSFFRKLIFQISYVISSVPHFLLVIIVQMNLYEYFKSLSFESKSALALLVTLTITHWMDSYRVLQSEVKQVLSRPFVESARALGATSTHLILRHVLPNLIPTYRVWFSLLIPQIILYEGFLSFVGLGLQPPQVSWGVLIAEGWRRLSINPALTIAPALMVFMASLTIYLINSNTLNTKN